MVQGIDYCVRVQDSKDYESGRYDNITPEDLEAALAANEDTPYLPPHCSGPQGWGALHASRLTLHASFTKKRRQKAARIK